MRSQRADGLGHWPRGKRRNPDRGNWSMVRLTLARFIDDHLRRGEISYRALAADLGVSDRTVRRWLAGEDRPPAELQEAAEQWVREWRDELKRRSRR